MANNGLNCSVTSCQYNQHGNDCSLQKIQVNPCKNCNNGYPDDESMCGSYRSRT